MHTVFLANYQDESATGTYRVVDARDLARVVVTEVPDCISPTEVAVTVNVSALAPHPEQVVVPFSELRWGHAPRVRDTR